MPNYTERTVLSKPRDFDQVANNAGSGGVINNNVTETINNVTVNGSAVSIFNQELAPKAPPKSKSGPDLVKIYLASIYATLNFEHSYWLITVT